MKNILITRTTEQAQNLNEFLLEEGFKTFIEPLFSVQKFDVKPDIKWFFSIKNTAFSAAILTSANAIHALKKSALPKNLKIFTTGKKTAEKIKESGFENVEFSAENSAKSLKYLIIKTHDNKSAPILHFHGSVMALDFAKELQNFGFKIDQILSYQTNELKNFSREFLCFSQKNRCDYVLIFSKNSAKNFLNLARKHNMLEYFESSQIFCLSNEIAAFLKDFFPKNCEDFSCFPVLKKFYDPIKT